MIAGFVLSYAFIPPVCFISQVLLGLWWSVDCFAVKVDFGQAYVTQRVADGHTVQN